MCPLLNSSGKNGATPSRAKAEAYEAARDIAVQRDSAFDFAEMILQLAIVLGSVSILAMSRLRLIQSVKPVITFRIVYSAMFHLFITNTMINSVVIIADTL